MSRDLTASQICERALRSIGAFPLSESAPDGEQMREALHWLDLNMAEIAGVGTMFHLIKQGLNFTLTPGTRQYGLSAALGANHPVDGIQFPVGAWLLVSGRRTELTIVDRDSWRAVSVDATPGVPSFVYIDRYPAPTLWTYPTLPTDVEASYTIQLDVQSYAPDVSPGGVSGTTPNGSALTGFRQAWQRFLIMRLSVDLASGPIFKLSEQSLARWERQAKEARRELLAFENREHDNEPPIAQPIGWRPPRAGGGGSGGGSASSSSGSGADFNDDFNGDYGG